VERVCKAAVVDRVADVTENYWYNAKYLKLFHRTLLKVPNYQGWVEYQDREQVSKCLLQYAFYSTEGSGQKLNDDQSPDTIDGLVAAAEGDGALTTDFWNEVALYKILDGKGSLTLGDYGVQNLSTMHLCLRLRGGGECISKPLTADSINPTRM
jgi:hypothetical protein